MSKIAKFLCCVLALSFLWSVGCKAYKNEVEARHLLNQCKTIKVGMSYQEVLHLMGEPMNVVEFEKNAKKKVRYYYLSPYLASTLTQCVVDKKSGLVEEVFCGEK